MSCAASQVTSLLQVDRLSVVFRQHGIAAVRDLSFTIRPGEIVALVGESGSGKSTAAMAMMGLLDRAHTDIAGTIRLTRASGESVDLLRLPDRKLREIRGGEIAMIFQEPMSSLDPIWRIGAQIAEAIRVHRRVSAAMARAESLRLLRVLAIPNAEKCLDSYPHQLSGGMCQRVMIALAMACRPRLLIADEPTSALDATIQAQIIEQLAVLRDRTGMAIMLITHDLGLVADIADRVLVIYAGQIVEAGSIATIFSRPRMPYTIGLMRSRPRLGSRREGALSITPIPGGVPNPADLPPGCSFHPRCAYSVPGRCDADPPELEPVKDEFVRCLRWQEIII